jgi:two-component system nitrogen regulation sensor histidine kinase NtrY
MKRSSMDFLFSEKHRRAWELIGMVVTSLCLVGLSRLETRLFELSKSLSVNAEFFTSVVYFGLININVILILLLSFLIFRNVAKLVLDRRRGVLGSKLRTKLVVSLVFFAVAPTALMFYISSSFITTSFDTWFSSKVRDTMQQTREAGAQVYKQDQRRLESLARIALQRVGFLPFEPLFPGDSPRVDATRLSGFETEYRLDGVKVYNLVGELVWSSTSDSKNKKNDEANSKASEFVLEAINRFSKEPGLVSKGTVEAGEKQDAVKGIAPIYYPKSGQLIGVVVTEEHFETQILRSIETILQEFANLRPGAQLIRISYLVLLVVMVLIIIFSTTWLGFYVAKGIVGPIQRLAEATREVALGNYNVSLETASSDETGALVKAFNVMTKDLRSHQLKNEEFTQALQVSNDELHRRQQYTEVILKNITAGVISVDSLSVITSFNSAAERLLGLKAEEVIGKEVRAGLGEALWRVLWNPLADSLGKKHGFTGEIDVPAEGGTLTLLTSASRIYGEHDEDLGVILVFDDATEQLKAQKVAAWREVARRIAHEIKNPLTPIKLSAQRLLRRYENEFEGENRKVFQSCIETILVQVDSLRDLVNEFSKFSRLPSIKTKPSNVNDLILDVANFYSLSYPKVQFDTSGLDSQIPIVLLDKEQMNRVVMNVVANALAALDTMEENPRIEFRSHLVPNLNAVRIEISDNGCGIPDIEKDKVFEPYYSTKKDGTGLGLAIVNQIVADHGGYVRLADRIPNGTVVVIDLPVGEKTLSKERRV